MRDVDPLELLVGAWILVFALVLLACVIAYIADFRRDPPPWWVRRQIPDTYDPNDWQPRGRDRQDVTDR